MAYLRAQRPRPANPTTAATMSAIRSTQSVSLIAPQIPSKITARMKRSSHIMRNPYPEAWIANHGDRPLALIDGRNVQRSQWPNLSDEELVRRSCRWARAERMRALVVFDGDTHARGDDEWCAVVPVRGETADEWLIRMTRELRERGVPYWLVTSDRELRTLAGGGAERTIGGGGFLKLVGR